MKLISIVTPCYNEEDNVNELYVRVKSIFSDLSQYKYEHLFIDNASTDKTLYILKSIAKKDQNIKIIANARNFGHIRSPFYGLLQTSGDAVVLLCADLQDPPEMIKQFIKKWENGYKIVIGVKPKSKENPIMGLIRRIGYRFINKISEIILIKNFTGFGLYDKKIIEILRTINDPYPYFRGIISEIGFKHFEIEYEQPKRQRGISKVNFYALYDIGMLGITSHSKIALRLATMSGFILSGISFILAFGFFIAKLLFWNSFSIGIAPILIGMLFFSAIQLIFIGLLGEYILSINVQVLKRPLVIEQERINF